MVPNIVYLYYIMDLSKIKTELYRRLEDSDEKKEAAYQKKRDAINTNIPDDGLYNVNIYRNEIEKLKKQKIREIRKDLGNDEGFQYLVSELDNIKANKKKKRMN